MAILSMLVVKRLLCNVRRVRLYVSTPITSRPQIKVAACQISPPAPASQEYSSSRIDSQRIYKCGTSPTATSKGTISFCWNTDLLSSQNYNSHNAFGYITNLYAVLSRVASGLKLQSSMETESDAIFLVVAPTRRVARNKRLLSRVYLFVSPGSKEISFDKRGCFLLEFYMNDVISLGRNSSVD